MPTLTCPPQWLCEGRDHQNTAPFVFFTLCHTTRYARGEFIVTWKLAKHVLIVGISLVWCASSIETPSLVKHIVMKIFMTM